MLTLKNPPKESCLSVQRISGVIYCMGCGVEYKEIEIKKICPICGKDEFLSGDFAARLAGYKELDKGGYLKKYYYLRRVSTIKRRSSIKKSIVKMNNKRILIQLLIMDNLISADDKEIADVIGKIMWRKH